MDNFNNFFLRIVHTQREEVYDYFCRPYDSFSLKVQLNCLNYIPNFHVCVAIEVIISIITTTCVLGGFDRASAIMHVFFVMSL